MYFDFFFFMHFFCTVQLGVGTKTYTRNQDNRQLVSIVAQLGWNGLHHRVHSSKKILDISILTFYSNVPKCLTCESHKLPLLPQRRRSTRLRPQSPSNHIDNQISETNGTVLDFLACLCLLSPAVIADTKPSLAPTQSSSLTLITIHNS